MPESEPALSPQFWNMVAASAREASEPETPDPFLAPEALELPESAEKAKTPTLDWEAVAELRERKPMGTETAAIEAFEKKHPARRFSPKPADPHAEADPDPVRSEQHRQGSFDAHVESGGEWQASMSSTVEHGDRVEQNALFGNFEQVGVGRRTATRTDHEGKVIDGSSGTAAVSRDGLALAASRTQNRTTTSAGVSVGRNGIGGSMDVGNARGGANVKVGIGKDHTLGVGVRRGAASADGSLTDHNNIERGELDDDHEDLREVVGEHGHYITRTSGLGASLGAKVTGTVGGSLEGHVDNKHEVTYAQAGDDELALPFPGVASKLGGVANLADVDVAHLAPGSAYSFADHHGEGGSAGLTLGVGVSLGKDDATDQQSLLGRDADGDLHLAMSESAQSEWSGSVDFKGGGIKHREADADASKIGLTAHGAEGEAAIQALQTTGALPGAEQVTARTAPEATAAFTAARTAWLTTQAAFDPHDVAGWQRRREEAQAKMRASAATVNDAFLKTRGRVLDAATVPGIEYDEHQVAHQETHDTSLSVLGLDLLHSGFSETESDLEYRDPTHRAHTERDFMRDDRFFWQRPEESHLALDPKGYAKDGDPVAAVLGATKKTTAEERAVLARLGPGAFGLPQTAVDAYRDGDMHLGEQQEIALTLTESQLAEIRDRVDPADRANVARAIHGVSAANEIAHGNARPGQSTADYLAERGEGRDIGRELDPLMSAARHARARALFAKGDASAALALEVGDRPGASGDASQSEILAGAKVEHDANQRELAALAKVETAKDFGALTLEEQQLVVAGSALENLHAGKSAYEHTLGLVLSVQDHDRRDELQRQLFKTDERRTDGADSVVNLIGFLEHQGTATVGPEETRHLLAGAAVRAKDDELRTLEATRAKAENREPGSSAAVLAHGLNEATSLVGEGMNTLPSFGDDGVLTPDEKVAAPVVRYLEAAGGPAGVEAVLREATKHDPDALENARATVANDPARAAQLESLLTGTKFDVAHQTAAAMAQAQGDMIGDAMTRNTLRITREVELARVQAMLHLSS